MRLAFFAINKNLTAMVGDSRAIVDHVELFDRSDNWQRNSKNVE